MIELLMAVLELLGLIDSQAKEEGPVRWYRRYPRVIRGVVITCWTLVCAVLFESLVQPFIIILLIPMSFIGVFLTFYFTGFSFDQGGFASLVMLSGIVVNAGIYIINQSNLQQKYGYGRNRSAISNYIRAYNHKIVPILLTIISTVLGLIPFLFDGKSEVFWFAFAVGTMGGLLFSIIALVFFMPVWLPE